MNNMQFIDGIDYESMKAPEAQGTILNNFSGEDIIDKYNFNEELKEELLEDINAFINEEVSKITLEFVSRFFERLGKGSKEAYAVARALGFHICLKDKDGKELQTLKDLAGYWNVCPQMLDLLSKQVSEDILEPIQNLAIHKKNYSYEVKAPDGYMTTGEVMKFLNLSNKKLNSAVKVLGIKKKEWHRKSRLIAEEDIDRIEIWMMEGKEL